MRILLLSLAALLAGSTFRASAQPSARQWLATGSLSASSNTTSPTEGRNSGLRISPSAGYFLTNHVAVGLGGTLGYATNKQRYQYAGQPDFTAETTTSNVRLNVFGRHYALLGARTAFTTTLAVGLLRDHRENTTDQPGALPVQERRTRGLGATLTPGLAWFPTSRFSLDVSAGNIYYERTTERTTGTDQKTKNSAFGAGFSLLNLAVGASFLLGGGGQ